MAAALRSLFESPRSSRAGYLLVPSAAGRERETGVGCGRPRSTRQAQAVAVAAVSAAMASEGCSRAFSAISGGVSALHRGSAIILLLFLVFLGIAAAIADGVITAERAARVWSVVLPGVPLVALPISGLLLRDDEIFALVGGQSAEALSFERLSGWVAPTPFLLGAAHSMMPRALRWKGKVALAWLCLHALHTAVLARPRTRSLAGSRGASPPPRTVSRSSAIGGAHRPERESLPAHALPRGRSGGRLRRRRAHCLGLARRRDSGAVAGDPRSVWPSRS